MDAVSYSHADKQKQRIEKFIEQPDSTSGVVTVPDTIASGESIEIATGRQIVVDHLDVQGTLDIQGTLATVSGGYLSQTTMKTQAITHTNGTNAMTIDSSGNVMLGSNYLTPYTGFKNRIINGDMRIDQRNAGASVTPTNSQFVVDRFRAILTQASKFSTQQVTTAPVGFKNSLSVTSLSAYSVVAGDVFSIVHPIEGLNTADLGWGTAGAATVTLSFWVRSSLTGTFGGSLANASQTRSYPFTYTINSANTFEYKTVTILGDTTGTWATNTSAGIFLQIGIGVGSTYIGSAGSWASANYWSATGATSVVGTNGATFYITGVQLEKGSTATSFDYRPYSIELQLCQRYFRTMQRAAGNAGTAFAIGTCYGDKYVYITQGGTHPVEMRSTPTLNTVSTFRVEDAYGAVWNVLYILTGATTSTTFSPSMQLVSNATAGRVVYLQAASDDSRIQLSAEL